MFAECRKCGYQLTVPTSEAAAIVCPACGGRIVLLSVTDAAPNERPAIRDTSFQPSPVEDLNIALPAALASRGWRIVLIGVTWLFVAILLAIFGILLTI